MVNNIEEMFEKAGAVLKGHFLLASGRHSPVYWEKFRILQRPDYVTSLCSMIAEHFRNQRIDLVAGPTTGGIILAFEVARQLGTPAIYAERAESGGRTFRRSQTINPGERVLIVDDVLTGGGSIRDVITAVTALEGNVIGIGVLVEQRLIDIELVDRLLHNTTIYFWEKMRPIFTDSRKRQPPDHQPLYDSAEYLYNMIKQRAQQATLST